MHAFSGLRVKCDQKQVNYSGKQALYQHLFGSLLCHLYCVFAHSLRMTECVIIDLYSPLSSQNELTFYSHSNPAYFLSRQNLPHTRGSGLKCSPLFYASPRQCFSLVVKMKQNKKNDDDRGAPWSVLSCERDFTRWEKFSRSSKTYTTQPKVSLTYF